VQPLVSPGSCREEPVCTRRVYLQGTVEDDLVSMLRAEAAAAPSCEQTAMDTQPAAVATVKAVETLARPPDNGEGGAPAPITGAASADNSPDTQLLSAEATEPQAARRATCLQQYWYAP
jgi:hypothetical protein